MREQQADCRTCHSNELRRFILAGKWAEDRGCWHHIASFPRAVHCARYEREPGSDDEPRDQARFKAHATAPL